LRSGLKVQVEPCPVPVSVLEVVDIGFEQLRTPAQQLFVYVEIFFYALDNDVDYLVGEAGETPSVLAK